MRPVVFGPSPFMQAALGVLGGKQAGEQRAAAEAAAARKMAFEEEDRATAQAREGRAAELDALTIAQRRLANETSTTAQARDRATEARVQAAAARLRTSPFNADGRYGKDGDPVDVKFNYAAELEKEAKIDSDAKQLMATGLPKDEAYAAARYGDAGREMAEKRKTAALEREKLRAGVAKTKAEAAAGAGGGTPSQMSAIRQAVQTGTQLYASGKKSADGYSYEQEPLAPIEARSQAIRDAVAIYGEAAVRAAVGGKATSASPAKGAAPSAEASPATLDRATWAQQNPAKPGEAWAAYQARYDQYAKGR